MHGVIFFALKRFVSEGSDPAVWQAVLADAGVASRVYLATQTYPDEELVALVVAAAKRAGTPVPTVLEGFGAFMAPSLLHIYRAHLQPTWRTLDVLAHIEGTMHKAVRTQDPTADPPRLACRRTSPTQVVITYSSSRRLCAVAKGMIRGTAAHFNETVMVAETECMHSGADHCTLVVDREPRERRQTSSGRIHASESR